MYTGLKYVIIGADMLQKNVKASLKQSDFKDIKAGRMYEYPNDRNACPYTAFEIYFEKVNGLPSFFPVTMKNGTYSKMRNVGKNTLGQFMKSLSKAANLSTCYSNHCVRVTLVNTLLGAGFTRSQVTIITGHKDENSLSSYERIDEDDILMKMSNALVPYAVQMPMSPNPNNETSTTIPPTTHNFVCSAEKKMRVSIDGNKNTIAVEFV